MKIASIASRLFIIPLPEVLTDARHGDHTHFQLVTATVTLEDGSQGTGYTYTGGKGGHAIQAMIEHDLAPAILGRDGTDIHSIWDFLEGHIHYVGRGGIASFAISAIDIALWDLQGKREGKPLWQLAGGADRSCNAYYGGIDLQFPLDKLLANISGYLTQGFRAVKIKVGRARLEEDVQRVQAVRELIGNDVTFMVDANYSMSVAQAIRAANAFQPFDIFWFEEPTLPDDYQGYARIAEATGMPLGDGRELAHHSRIRLCLGPGGAIVHSTGRFELRRHHGLAKGSGDVASLRAASLFPRHARTSRQPCFLPAARRLDGSPQLRNRPLHTAAAASRKSSRRGPQLARHWSRVRLAGSGPVSHRR